MPNWQAVHKLSIKTSAMFCVSGQASDFNQMCSGAPIPFHPCSPVPCSPAHPIQPTPLSPFYSALLTFGAVPCSRGVTNTGGPREFGFRKMNGLLRIHYVHWNGTCEIMTSPAKAQLRVNIPSNALLMMTVHTLIKAYRLLLTTYHLPPTTYRFPLTFYHLPLNACHCLLLTADCSMILAHSLMLCVLLAAYGKL